MKLNGLDILFYILLIVGGLNWGLVGLLNLDLVATLFGPMSLISRLVYILVGISAIYVAVRVFCNQREISACCEFLI